MENIMNNSEIDMWGEGWKLGKYNQLGEVPTTQDEAREWIAGFQLGCVEIVQYENWDIRIEAVLDGFPETWKLVKSVIEQTRL